MYTEHSFLSLIAKFMGQHGAHLGPTSPRWAPCWPHELCYLGCFDKDPVHRHALLDNIRKLITLLITKNTHHFIHQVALQKLTFGWPDQINTHKQENCSKSIIHILSHCWVNRTAVNLFFLVFRLPLNILNSAWLIFVSPLLHWGFA